ncbi:LOB domain-containing protein 36-like [Andrographis paniculata]|uniref:LOB domain-containing protein 36-like n=1 Tax=Andrographis paniculata TaxID=175694 RepID=UPI0021E955C1|nr:LOB domain-containing protein 36-like [Andrographis paniculata]XP_051140239.1 LOB domain-containing protein 36-like [Andrographis paniculata]XP_051140240.1 LOB domain-containing protein 36-like [Andrographis paniculata]
MSSSNSPCAACKCLRRKCTQECVFAPYFPPDNPQKFTNVHRVFGASNVTKLLNELNASQREDAVNSLAYEAEYRLRDPVYGCVGLISLLQNDLKQVQHALENAKKELATYIGPSAMLPIFNHPSSFIQQHQNYGQSPYPVIPYTSQPMAGLPTGVPHGGQFMIRDPQQQQYLEAQQLAAVAAAREQEMLRTYGQQQQQQNDLVRFNSGLIDDSGGFNQIPGGGMQPSLALGSSFEALPYHQIQQQPTNVQESSNSHSQSHSHSQSQQLQIQQHELLMQQQQLPQLHASESQQQPLIAKSEGAGSIDPSC